MVPSLTPDQRALVERMAGELAGVPGVVAVALGGSHAQGLGTSASDVDLGLYYRDAVPPDLPALRTLAARLDPRPERVVTELGEWGPWVDGGAWLRVEGQPVDWLYRSLDRLAREIDAAARGERIWDYAQQPTHGFHSHILLAELAVCEPLVDPEGDLAGLKGRVVSLPRALRESLVNDFLWHVEFTLYHARAAAERGDVYNTAGCLNRAAACLVQVHHAQAGRWFIGDKRALDAIEPDVAAEIAGILSAPGSAAAALAESVARMERLFDAAARRAGALYRRPFDLAAVRGVKPSG